MKKSAFIAFILLYCLPVLAQNWQQYLPEQKIKDGTITLADYQEAFKKYTDMFNVDQYGYITRNGAKERMGGWKQFKRWEWFMESQVDPVTGQFPKTDAWTEWNRYLERYPDAGRSPNGDWTCLGPETTPGGYNGLGRLNCVAFHPDNPDILWAGAPSGGIWKRNGATWTELGDDLEIMGVSDIVIPNDFSASNTIYIATGDRNTWSGNSIGVLKSTDGGNTWQATDLSYNRYDFKYVNRLLKHPVYDNIIYAATSDGVYKTTDGGNSFTLLVSHEFIDMEFHPTNANIIYGSTKKHSINSKIFRSVDAGITWNQVFDIQHPGRTELAASSNEPDWVYAVTCNSNGGLRGVYRSTNSGLDWTLQFDGMLPNQNLLGWAPDGSDTTGQGNYDLCIAVNPANALHVYIGGINTWKSTDGGTSWNIINVWKSGYGIGVPVVHADKHFLIYRPGTTHLYECNDGGIYRSTDHGTNWTDLSNGLIIGQIYRLSTAQTVAEEILTGYQDVGSKLLSNSSWSEVLGGDGMHNIINPQNVQNQYASTQNGGGIHMTNNHWNNSTNIRENIPDTNKGAWITPFVLHPVDHNTVFVGLNDLWKSLNQGADFTLVYDIPIGQEGLRVIAIAPSAPDHMIIANKWHIYKTIDGGTTWDDITTNLPFTINANQLLEDITFKHDDENVFWIAVTGYNQHCVYRTGDGGESFTNISEGLPSVPVHAVIQNTLVTNIEELYCATAAGVFRKSEGMPWVSFNNNLPKVYCRSLAIYYDGINSKLRLGTWGRGVWESSIETEVSGLWTGNVSSNWGDINNWSSYFLPDANTDVTIPNNRPHYPVISGTDRSCHSLVISNDASLDIDGVRLNVNNNLDVHGSLQLLGSNASLYVDQDITWHSGSSVYVGSNSNSIYIGDDWHAKAGSTVELDAGTVLFQNANTAHITCNTTNAYFHHLHIAKPAGTNTYYSSVSTHDLVVMGDLTISENSLLISFFDQNITVNGFFITPGSFHFHDGTFIYEGINTNWNMTADSYFHNLNLGVNPKNVFLQTNMTVKGNISTTGGYLIPQTHTVYIEGNWLIPDNWFYENDSKVVFCGSSAQTTTLSNNFNIIELNKPSDTLKIISANISCNQYIWNSGVIMVQNGNFTANDLYNYEGIDGEFYLKSGTIDLTNDQMVNIIGNITIENGVFIVRGGIIDSYWPYSSYNGSLHMTAGTLDFKDVGIIINGMGSGTFIADITGGKIRTAGSFQGTESMIFRPSGGTVELYGPSDVSLSHGTGNFFHELRIAKSSSRENSIPPLISNHSAANQFDEPEDRTSPPGAKKAPPPGGSRAMKVSLTGYVITNDLQLHMGELDLNGHTMQVNNDFEVSLATLTMNNTSDLLKVGGNTLWKSNSNANANAGIIEFHNDWTFASGTHAMFSGSHETRPAGSSAQLICANDDNARFQKFVNYNTTAPVTISADQTHAMRVTDDLILVDGAQLLIYDSLIVGDVLLIQNGSSVTLDGNATVILDNEMTLRGSLTIDNGELRIGNMFISDPTGVLTINGGSFINDAPYSSYYNLLNGITLINDGTLEISNNGLELGSSSSFDMNGGILKLGWNFKTNGIGVFAPTGGTLEFIGSEDAMLECTTGNYPYKLRVSKNNATLTLANDLEITNALIINSGSFSTAGYYMDVGEGVYISTTADTLALHDSYVTVGGQWRNLKGPDGLDEGTSTVTFNGPDPFTFTTHETFYNINIAKNLAPGQYVTLDLEKTLGATNNFQIQSGALMINHKCTLDVYNLSILAGAGLVAEPDSTRMVINVKGNWSNSNSGYTDNTGFNYGKSLVSFTGNTQQTMTSSGGEVFYSLLIDKPSGKFIPMSYLTVNYQCAFENGEWDFTSSVLNFYFHKDLIIEETAIWNDSTANIYFVGEGEQWLKNLTGTPMIIDDLIVDQPTGFPASSLTLLGELTCKNWARATTGELKINGQTLNVDVRLQATSGGKISGEAGSVIKMGDGATLFLNGGILDLDGTHSDPANITNRGSGHYTFSIVNQGYFSAVYTIAEYMNQNGVHFYNNGLADTVNGYAHCIFRNGAAQGTLMKFETPQVVELTNVVFPENTWMGYYNITKLMDDGEVTVIVPYGDFIGPTHENDPNDRIHWPDVGRWKGTVSGDWHTPGNWYYDVVPDEYINVYIPAGTTYSPRINTGGGGDCRTLTIENGASLLLDGNNLAVEFYADIAGQMGLRAGRTLTLDSLNWKPGSTGTMGTNSIIRVSKDMIFEEGSNVSFGNGIIEFYSVGNSRIKCLDNTNTVYHLHCSKVSGGTLTFDVGSGCILEIKGNLINASGATITGEYPGMITINGYYDNQGGYFRMGTHVKYTGDPSAVPLKMNIGDYFYNLTLATTARLQLDNTYCDTLWIKGNLSMEPGTSGTSGLHANGVFIWLYGHWHNTAGPDAFIHWDNTVEIKHGTSMREISGTNIFYNLVDNTLGNAYLRLIGPTEVEHDLIIHHYVRVYNELTIYNELNLNNSSAELNLFRNATNVETGFFNQGGTLSGIAGSFTAWDLVESLIHGTYNLEGTANVSLYQDAGASVNLGADVTLAEGAQMNVHGGNGTSNWPALLQSATLNMSDNALLTFHDQGINICVVNTPMESFTANIDGGTIRTTGNFTCCENSNTVFHPSGGLVELIGTENKLVAMPGVDKEFYNLKINKTASRISAAARVYVQNNFNLQSGIYQTVGYPLIVYGSADIQGHLNMGAGDDFSVDSLNWKTGSTAAMGTGSMIMITDDMIFEAGSGISLTNGTIEFSGADNSFIKCLASTCQIHHLVNAKNAPAILDFNNGSTSHLIINGNLTNESGATLTGSSSNKIFINGFYKNNGGHFYMTHTHIVFSGDPTGSPLEMNTNDYFRNLTIETTSVLNADDTYSDTLRIDGEFRIEGVAGMSGLNANGVFMLVKGNWINNVGSSGFIHGENIVEFKHNLYPINVSGHNIFYILYDKTSGLAEVNLYNTTDVERTFHILHKVNVHNTLLVNHVLDMSDPDCQMTTVSGSNIDASNFAQGGTLVNSGNFTAYDLWDARLQGTYTVNGGNVILYQDAGNSIDLDANINITSGRLMIYGGNAISTWPAPTGSSNPSISISGGMLDIMDQGIHIEVTSQNSSITTDITGGYIYTKGNFYCRGNDTGFKPAGGIIEIYGNTNTDCEMSGATNAFYILRTRKTNDAAVKVLNEINIQNSLVVRRGYFDLMGNPVNIGE